MRPILTAIAASVLLVTLTGCNPFTDPYEDQQRDGGITPAAAESALLDVDGISAAEYGTYEWYNPGEGGMFSSSGMDVVLTVTIDPDYSVDDHEAFLEYLAATAWSVNDHYPKGAVVIQLLGGEDVNYDWLTVAQQVFTGLKGFTNASSAGYDEEDADWHRGGRVLAISADAYGARFGRWPSGEVEAPAGLLENEPFAQILVPAITDLRLTIDEVGEKPCYHLSFARSGQSVVYSGEVSATLLSASGDELQTETSSDFGNYVFICFDEDDFPEGASVDVSTGEYSKHEFLPVTENVEVSDS